MDIPEDVMKAATKCGETVCRNLDYDGVSVEVAVIANVILAERDRATAAERERCAKVAESHFDLRHADKARFASASIAAAIRKPPEQL